MKKIITIFILMLLFLITVNAQEQEYDHIAILHQKEIESIKKYSKERVLRVNKSLLKIKLDNGEYIIKEDMFPDTENDNQVVYIFDKYISNINWVIIDMNKWEEFDVLAINLKNGMEYSLPDIPYFNQNYNKFICIESCPFYPIQLHIFSLINEKLISEFHYELNNWSEAINPIWINNNEIQIAIYEEEFSEDKSEDKQTKYLLKLKYVGNSWKVIFPECRDQKLNP